jgi:hypothetical protein
MSNQTRNAFAELVKACGLFGLWSLITGTFTACLMVTAVVGVLIVRLAGPTSTDLTVGSVAAKVAFQSIPAPSRWAVIHPNGWQDSHILVKRGQRIDCSVGGSVNIDLSGTVELALLRRDYEAQVLRRLGRTVVSSDVQPPEDSLSPSEIEQLSDRLRFQPWAGPNGHNPVTAVSRSRSSRRAMPGAPLGALIAQIRYGDSPEQSTSPFLVGERLADFEVPQSGALWFNVNDVIFPGDPDLYYADNVGFFFAVVTLR